VCQLGEPTAKGTLNNKLFVGINRKAPLNAPLTTCGRFLITKVAAALSATCFLSVASAPAAPLQTLHGHVPALIAHLQPVGRLPASQHLNLAIGLPLRDQARLEAFLKELYDPASLSFHHFLTPEEFTSRFGPTEADYASVIDFARTNGFTITATHANRSLLEVAAPAAAVEKAFHLTLRTYRDPTENRDFFAPDTEPSVPAELPVADVSGLSDYSRPHPNSRLSALPLIATPNNGSGPGGTFLGNDFLTAYVPGTALTGAGQSVGLLQFDGFYAGDIAAYAAAAGGGRTSILIQTISTDGYNGVPTTGSHSGNGEVSLDIEMAMAMAPGLSSIVVFEADPTNGQPNTILAAMVTNTAIKQFSSSWTWSGGPNVTTENYFLTMAAQGQSYFNASGDGDAFAAGSANDLNDPNQNRYPAGSPTVTAVGGTKLTMNGTGASYASETVWNDGTPNPNGGDWGSSGGVSATAIPVWQQGISMVTNLGSTSLRNAPDVALTAYNVYVKYGNGASGGFEGTSCAAPLWAGFMALVNQRAASLGYPSAGLINPAIYAIGKGTGTASYASAFHDITTGNNEWPGSPTNFPAVAGYDLCTGWGTPTVNLVTALVVPVNPMVMNAGDGDVGSLRYVVAYATNGTTITFATNLSGQTITLTNGEIALNKNLHVDASALANGVRINANHNSRIFNVAGGVSAVLSSLTLTNSYPGAGISGGAIVSSGTLTLNNCTLAGNSVDTSATGGAIWSSGPLTLAGCTLSGNAGGFAGAINNYGATCNLQNCTFFGNVASSGNGGAIDNVYDATLNLLQCTFSGNSAVGAGGGIDNYLSQLNVTNTIVAVNIGLDIYNWASSAVGAGGSNIVQQLGSSGTVIGDASIIAANPLLGPLANNGGPTLTLLPQIGSPAIDAGVTSLAAGLTYDQRGPGYPRVVGGAVDIGAVEAGAVPYVFNSADSGYGSLRYAANYTTNNSIITFAPGLSGQTITLTSGEIALINNVQIDASVLTNGVWINGNHNSRIFNVAAGSSVLSSLTLTNAYAGAGNSGGAIVNAGTLTLTNCTLAGNSVDASAVGGAIYNAGELALTACTLAGNSAGFAGAIQNYSGCALVNCTLAGNVAVNNGGAIDNDFSGANLYLAQCTFSGNTAGGAGGGVDNYQATTILANSLIGGNIPSGSPDIFNWPQSIVTVEGTNLVPYLTSAGTLDGAGAVITAAPMLAPLGNYGGPTLTMPPLRGSPAIDGGSDAAAGGIATDQRGYPRVSGLRVDIGAVEAQIAHTAPVLSDFYVSGTGTFYLGFTNLIGGGFTVFASTNAEAALSTWPDIGAAVESPTGSGHFLFADPQAKNYTERFYRVTSP